MSKKLTYEYVKNFIENEKFQLLSTEYKSVDNKLNLQCPNQHIFQIRFHDFQKGIRCSICSGKQRHNHNYVKSFIEKEKYVLLSNEYKNNRTKLNIKCNKNHIFQMTFHDFQQGQRCSVCANNKKHTYDYVKNYIENYKYRLLSTKYENAHEKLNIQCNNGHKYKVKFNDFQQGCRCPICVTENQKLTYDYVKNFIEKENYQLLSDKYELSNKKMSLKCDKGHIFEMTFANFQRGIRCPECAKDRLRLTYNDVKSFIEKENYQLLSTEYKNNHTKLQIKCDKGHQYSVIFNNFKQGNRCPICFKQQNFSIPEKEVLSFVKTLYNGLIIENDRTQLRNPLTGKMLELDIYLPLLNKAIEFNGIHWHSSKYSKWKDNQKIILSKQKNINLLVIEEKDWIINKQNCLDKIKEFIPS